MSRGMIVVPNREAIRQARRALMLTQKQLAERAGSTPIQVYRIERGSRNTSVSTLKKFAVALGIADFRELVDIEASLEIREQDSE